MMPLPRRGAADEGRAGLAVRHEDCWAKTDSGQPGISVAQHCRTAGIVADILAGQLPEWLMQLLAARTGVILAALHDIGKVSPGFQKKCPVWLKRQNLGVADVAGMEEDHGKISQKTLQDLLAREDLRWWAAIVGAHHGKLKGDRIQPLCDGGAVWAAERRRLVDEMIKEFGPLPERPPRHFDCGELWFNAGLIAVADWLASDERSFPPSKSLDTPASRERAEKQLDRIGLRPTTCLPGKSFNDLFSFQPNALQNVLAEAVRRPGVYVVEAAMGRGKTEAALMAAYGLLATGQSTGIYFALPTQVTSNRIHRRVAEFIDRIAPGSGARLIHGNSWLMETEQPLTDSHNGEAREWTGRDWFASPRRALLAPFGVGTVDQALLGVVAAKHFFVRQFALAGKVVILDEVHSYDLYTGTLLNQLVVRLRELGATVIILSATLTAARRQELLGAEQNAALASEAAYPLVSAGVDGQCRRWPVEPEPARTVQVWFKNAAELADAGLERAQGGQCVLWIRNTVNDAQETYRQLCGRNRVGGPELTLPTDIRQVLEATYAEPAEDEPASWGELRRELEARKKKLQSAALANGNPWQVALDDEEGVQTRWNSQPTVMVLLVEDVVSWDGRRGAVLQLLDGARCELHAGEFDFGSAKAIHRNVVKVPRWCVRAHLGRTPDWLREYVRDDILICQLVGGELLWLPGKGESGLTYRNEQGVGIPSWGGGVVGLVRQAEEDENESYD